MILKRKFQNSTLLLLGRPLIFILPFLPYFWTAWRLDYMSYNNASDSFLYLDIARNLLAGRGLVTSFNIYQYWTGIFYPVVPFVQFGLSFLLAIIYAIVPSVKALIFLNFPIMALNAFLIFSITKQIYKDNALGYWLSFLFIVSVTFEVVLLRIMTEPLSLLITFTAVAMFISGPFTIRRAVGIGLLLSIGFFIRTASIIYPLAFFLALIRQDKQRHSLFWFLISALGPILFYEVFVYAKFHTVFPQYSLASKNQYLAVFVNGGRFFPALPVTRPFSYQRSEFLLGWNLLGMVRVLFCILRYLLLFSIIRIFRVFKKGNKEELLLIWLAILPMATTLIFYPYMRINYFAWTRYLILPAVCLGIIGIKELKDVINRFFKRTKTFLFCVLMVVLCLSNFYQSYKVLEFYWKDKQISAKARELRGVAEWFKKNTAKSDLVAVSNEEVAQCVYLERPMVALPYYKMSTTENWRLFLTIYDPKFLIFEKQPRLERLMRELGYEEVLRREAGLFTVLRRR